MKKTLLIMLLVLAWPVCAGVVDDAIQLEKAGISNEVLLAWARQQKGYTISINDMLQLNLNNVPGNVIAVLIRNASAVIGSAAAEQAQPVAPVVPQNVYEDVPSYYPEGTYPVFYPFSRYPYCNGYPDFGEVGYCYPDFGLNFGFGLDFGFGNHHHHHHEGVVHTPGRAGRSTGSRALADNRSVVHSSSLSHEKTSAASHAAASTRATSAQRLTANSSSSFGSARPNTMQRSSTGHSYSYNTPSSYSHSSSYSAPRSYSQSYSYSAPRSYSSGYSGGYHGYSGGGFSGGGHGGGGHR